MFSCSSTYLNTSPLRPQPKQCHTPIAGRTLKLGVFSSWNGHRPTYDPMPEGFNATVAETISCRSAALRTFSMSSL